MKITAKYASECPACHVRIAVGSQVEWSRGSAARHVTCGPVTAVAKAAHRGAFRSTRRSGAGQAARVPGYSSYCTDRPSCRCYDCAS